MYEPTMNAASPPISRMPNDVTKISMKNRANATAIKATPVQFTGSVPSE